MTTIKSITSGIGKIKDILYIVSFVVLLSSFLVNEGKNRQKQDDLIKEMQDVKETLKDQEKIQKEQLVLNGQIIMYMKLDQKLHENE